MRVKYLIPFLVFVLVFGFACSGISIENEKIEEAKEVIEEEVIEESIEVEVVENVTEKEIIEEEIIKEDAKIEYEIIYTLNHLRYDDGITYYVLINSIDLSDDTFKDNIKKIIGKIVEEKGKKISIEIFDKRDSLENGYKDSKFDEAMDLEEWANWFTDEIINDLAIHSIATYDGELEAGLYLNTLYFFIYSDYIENTIVDKYAETIEFNP